MSAIPLYFIYDDVLTHERGYPESFGQSHCVML